MSSRNRGALLVFLLLALVLATAFARSRNQAGPADLDLQPVAQPDSTGFTSVEKPVQVRFPEDFGPHPEYLTEWWYYTGNLQTDAGRHFGYQLTFFRRALAPITESADRQSGWAAEQLYMAHFALTDTGAGEFQAVERFSRDSLGLAGAMASPFRVWLEDWQVTETSPGRYRLEAKAEGYSLDLELKDVKGPILQGEDGYSPKGPQIGNASVYISQTRMEAQGTARVGNEAFFVSGLSWMDHEYSTSALGEALVGWDWFSLQLDDGTELMLFILRHADGQPDPYSSGTVIDRDGGTTSLQAEDFAITPTGRWRSPRSGAEYPSGWRIEITSQQLDLEIIPRLRDQELNVSFVYWEGAVQVRGTRAGQVIGGQGYIELTGYAASMQGQF